MRPLKIVLFVGILFGHGRGFAEVSTGIKGRITEKKSGEGLIEATVKVIRGAHKSALTDVDGNYELRLPPGEYEVRVYYELYEAQRLKVVVRDNEISQVDVKLGSDEGAVQEVVVEAKADTRKEAAVLQVRRQSAVVSDAISAQEISRSADSSAADAMKRLVAATVIDGKYVVLRGLGGRYSNTVLGGVSLPSPDPDEPAVPLDLFPNSLLANLTVAKSYAAHLPANFAGGALVIDTNAYPDQTELKVKISTSGDTSSTFQHGLGYGGGNLDFLGYDDGGRNLPDAVPSDRPLVLGRDGITPQQVERAGEAFSNNWAVRDRQSYPNLGLSGQGGGTWRLPKGKLGYLASINYARKDVIRRADVASTTLVGQTLQVREQLANLTAQQSGQIGLLGNVGYKPSDRHDFNALVLYTHVGDRRAQQVTGYAQSDSQNIETNRLEFVTRELTFMQLRGEHVLSAVQRDRKLLWQAQVSWAGRDEPDTRDLVYHKLGADQVRFKNGPGSAERFFSDLSDRTVGGNMELRWPIRRADFRIGSGLQHTDRDLSARRFRFMFVGSDPAVLSRPADTLLTPDTIGPSFRLEERTLPTDAYGAGMLVFSGFSSVEMPLSTRWPVRVIGGARYELSQQNLSTGSRFAITEATVGEVKRTEHSVIPTVNVVWSPRDTMNVRAGYSYTLARPQFREIAPFLYFDFARRMSVSGNPDLAQTRIHNADLRWEWFASEREVFAASVFFKRFVRPIERVIVSAAQGDVSFANAADANTVGAEFEARASFGRVWRKLSDLYGTFNATVSYSRVNLGDGAAGPQTSSNRPLEGQSPYVINTGLWYSRQKSGTEISLLYNVFGPRISEVGVDQLPDVYEQPLHRMDLTVGQYLGPQMWLKASASNLLHQAVSYRQGDTVVYRYQPGVSVGAALEWAM